MKFYAISKLKQFYTSLERDVKSLQSIAYYMLCYNAYDVNKIDENI